jgi:hypothetical protein
MSNGKWRDAFEKQRQITEKRNISKFTRYYQGQYNKGVDNVLNTGNTNYQNLFTVQFFNNMYLELFQDTSMHFAKWYARTFDKLIKKGVNSKEYVTQWQAAFGLYAKQVAATNVVLVSGTAKKTLVKITQRLFSDPEFMTLGYDAKARILKKQFKKYSRYQAQRLVRTETTRAANYGVEQSALTVFPGENLIKEWSTSLDGRERDWHGVANGQKVKQQDSFIVGGEAIMRPGEGSGRNVINCRCSAIYYPDQSNQPSRSSNLLFNIGAGLAINELTKD